jgi:hypothetical protein
MHKNKGVLDMQTQHVQHNDLLDVSLFDMPIKKVNNPTILLKDINGIEKPTLMDNQVIVYRPDTMDILGRSRSKKYKIVEPAKLYTAHAKKLLEQKNLPLSDVIIDDYVYEGGRKQLRTVGFPSLTKVMPDNSKVSMRSDIFNSVDMSWMYQAFAGAYRDLCRNSLVFGGQRMYHIRQKHTTGLNVMATLKSISKTFELFSENQELMQKMIEKKISLEQMAHILAGSICKKKNTSAQLLGHDTKIDVNYKLLDYFIHLIRREESNLGLTAWNLFNALTHWSTHIDDTFERQNEKTGEFVECKTTRAGSQEHTSRTKREDKVREFMNTEEWNNLLLGVYVIPKGTNLRYN